MQRIVLFFKTYFKEIGACTLTLAAAFAMILGSFELCGIYNISVARLSSILLFSVLFTLNTAVCCSGCKKMADIHLARIIVLICAICVFAVFVIVYIRMMPEFQGEHIACILAIGCLTYMFSNGIVDARWEKILEHEDPNAYIILLIKSGRLLSKQQQITLLSDPRLENWLRQYIRNYYLCEEAEYKLFAEPHADDIRAEYIKRYNLNSQTQPLLFHLPDVNKWIRLCIEARCLFTQDSVREIFKLSEAPELIGMHIRQGTVLSDDCEMLLFELPNGEILYNLYRQKYFPCENAEKKAKELGWI